MADDNPFTVKLGRIMSPGGTGRFVSFAGRVRRACLLYTSPSPRDRTRSRMPSSA